MNSSVLIIGYGSIGKRHAKILRNRFKFKNIIIFTKQKLKNFKTINKLSDVKKLDPFYIVIASVTSLHFKHLKYIEKNFSNKKILIEKPIFEKYKKLKIKKNKVFVGYNLRFNRAINFVKNFIVNKKVIDIKILCNSYLPNWRKRYKL